MYIPNKEYAEFSEPLPADCLVRVVPTHPASSGMPKKESPAVYFASCHSNS